MLINKAMPLVFILSGVSLVGVGFSSWTITKTSPTTTINGDIQIADVLDLISVNGTEGNITICKYGFLYENSSDPVNNRKIITTYSYNYIYSLNQVDARKGGFISNNSANFYINIDKVSTSNNFINLFSIKYYSATAYIKYNNQDTSTSNFTVNNGTLSTNIALNNMTQNNTEEITFVITFTFDESKSASLDNYLKTLDITKGFSFKTTIGISK